MYPARVPVAPTPYDVHTGRRKVAYVVAANRLNADPLLRAPVELGPIDADAIADFQTWQLAPTRSESWDWARHARRYKHHWYARLDLAVRSGGVVCGLALGRFSPAGTVLQLNLIEGAPRLHPLKGAILYIAVAYGIVLATGYNSRVFRAKMPRPHVRTALARLQPPFRYVAHDPNVPYDYCERTLP